MSAKCLTCGRVDYKARLQVAPPMTQAEADAACIFRDSPDCVRIALAARDAELTRLRAAVPADVAGLVERLRTSGRAMLDPRPGLAADALESLARELATAQRDAAEAQQFMDDNIHALDELPRLKRELAAKDEALRLEVAHRAVMAQAMLNAGCPKKLVDELDPAARAMLDRIAKLEAVAKHAGHDNGCNRVTYNGCCDCGFAQLDDGKSGEVKP